ncbi:hypothetical protein AYI69_g360 [Smittium culicis]|uniref:Uncharacterized protein n=1 Tax=Smittium culicis TaxID=133412 RepID=A0A1R1YTA7_9FUNG|nr:hypothetical protein AYI69_g360 [Smittium culicis]
MSSLLFSHHLCNFSITGVMLITGLTNIIFSVPSIAFKNIFMHANAEFSCCEKMSYKILLRRMVPRSALDSSFVGNDNFIDRIGETLSFEEISLILHAIRHQFLLINSGDFPIFGFGISVVACINSGLETDSF